MEGAAIAQTAAIQYSFLDRARDQRHRRPRSNRLFDEFILEAGKRSAEMVLAFVETLK